jgi:glycosyltransferase involved in cell wall biosynthesis
MILTIKEKMSKSLQRILVIAHGHRDFSLGGGEISAYNLYKGYLKNSSVQAAWFLARADKGRGPTGAISLRRSNEYLWEQSVVDYFGTRFKAANLGSVLTVFKDLISGLKPTVVHTHHYAHLGLEYLRVIKQVDPSIKIMMTLHEYMAICANNGQMIKTGSMSLCSQATDDDCHGCFPAISAEEFWLRKHYFTSYFDLVDQFIAPSEFLRQRYIAWGLEPERIVVIENGQTDEPPLPPRPLAEGETRNRFGYFGQINPFKGLTVVLEALASLPKADRKKIVLEVHGANLEHQREELREKINFLAAPLIKQGVVRFVGPYRPDELRQRMAHVDWVVVPSTWWENSPMVIQEAFAFGRPVICSDIGGMAEKIRHGVNGLHVPVGNAPQWAKTFKATCEHTTEWEGLRSHIVRPISYSQCATVHINHIESE